MSRETNDNPQNLFFQLTPDFVLDAVENAGWRTTGEYLQLNSYENRVFSIKTEEEVAGASAVGAAVPQIIVKFYRPGRWSEAAIREEHSFLEELSSQGVAVVPPLKQKSGDTLSVQHGLWFAAFPKFRGRMPQELGFEELTRIGRVLARLHNVGALAKPKHRAIIDSEHFGRPALELISGMMNHEIWHRYEQAAEGILEFLESEMDPRTFQRIHGDAHRGNILMTDEAGKPPEFFLVDFDDFALGPPVQDFWMLFRHDEDDFGDELDAFLDGYTELRDFDESQLRLMEPLRGLRIIHYAAWIARRWQDPSFPKIFPNFGTDAYWFEEMQALEKVRIDSLMDRTEER